MENGTHVANREFPETSERMLTMPRFTQKYMIENFASVSDERDLLNLYLHDTQTGRMPNVEETFVIDGDETGKIQLWRATSAHGGYVVVMQSYPRIHFLDDLNRMYRDNHSPYSIGLRTALERLTAWRNRLAEEAHVSQIR
jgi:hypothetical protein